MIVATVPGERMTKTTRLFITSLLGFAISATAFTVTASADPERRREERRDEHREQRHEDQRREERHEERREDQPDVGDGCDPGRERVGVHDPVIDDAGKPAVLLAGHP